MIYILMHGRLGNQMFQYAFAKKLQKERNDEISIYFMDSKKDNGVNGWKNDLENFNVGHYNVLKSLNFLFFKTSFVQKLLLLIYFVRTRLIFDEKKRFKFQESQQEKLNKRGIYWIRNGIFSPINSKEKNIFINGHFEYSSFYDDSKNELTKMFSPKFEPLAYNNDLYKIIQNTESVCISIRRGDFLSAGNFDKYFICDKKYFDRAIEVIKKCVAHPVFIVFSDDIDWIKNNYRFDGEVYYETDNNPVWEKIRLMYSCKHFIISNSTFSWWSQYLSRNENKYVISPNIWKKNSDWKGLISDSFITIDV